MKENKLIEMKEYASQNSLNIALKKLDKIKL